MPKKSEKSTTYVIVVYGGIFKTINKAQMIRVYVTDQPFQTFFDELLDENFTIDTKGYYLKVPKNLSETTNLLNEYLDSIENVRINNFINMKVTELNKGLKEALNVKSASKLTHTDFVKPVKVKKDNEEKKSDSDNESEKSEETSESSEEEKKVKEKPKKEKKVKEKKVEETKVEEKPKKETKKKKQEEEEVEEKQSEPVKETKKESKKKVSEEKSEKPKKEKKEKKDKNSKMTIKPSVMKVNDDEDDSENDSDENIIPLDYKKKTTDSNSDDDSI